MNRVLQVVLLSSLPASALAACPSTLATDARLDCIAGQVSALQRRVLGLETEKILLQNEVADLQAENEALQSEVAALSPLLTIANIADYLTIDTDTDSLLFTGANLYVQSGSGATDGPVNGLGNLIVGYDENYYGSNIKTGSHNIVVGPGHTYTSYAGLVAGTGNAITGPNNSVTGGFDNTASGYYASVTGGSGNTASGAGSSISGGFFNTASDSYTSVSGGVDNTASGVTASVCGGSENTASGFSTTIAGGRARSESTDYSYP